MPDDMAADEPTDSSPRTDDDAWVVWRQDDNGNRFEVARRNSRTDAEDLAATMEARSSGSVGVRPSWRGRKTGRLGIVDMRSHAGWIVESRGRRLSVGDRVVDPRFADRMRELLRERGMSYRALGARTFFCVAEAMRDLGGPVVVLLDAPGDQLRLVVTGSDRGGLPLGHMRDRVEAAGGSVSITVEQGHAVIEVRAAGHQRPAVDHASSSWSGPKADLLT